MLFFARLRGGADPGDDAAKDVEAEGGKPISTAIGSGPFRFNHGARISGALTVFDRNTDYVPRKETPDGLTGARLAKSIASSGR